MGRDDDILWRPSDRAFGETQLAEFARRQGFDPRDYDSLHRWSVSEKGAFWGALWDHAGVIGDRTGPDFVPDPAAPMTGARFFPEARLNLAENLLSGPGDAPAVYAGSEIGGIHMVTRDMLRARVERVASGLVAAGVRPGDRVCGVMPNDLDALVATLAALRIGATWTACSPDFGARAIIERFGQVEPAALFFASRYRYNGREHDISDRISEVLAAVPSITTLVETGKLGGNFPGAVPMSDFGEAGAAVPASRFPFAHPAYILYTSGTTGRPKAIVHSAGGALMKHICEHLLHGDVGPGDRVMWYTNIAWMMYPWMLGAMACGAPVALYDGAPIVKTAEGLDCRAFWSFVEGAGVTQLGVSPKYLATLQSEGYRPGDLHDLGALRHLMVCGAPCLPHQFDWVYDAVAGDIPFSSISGGTEILGCFLVGSPLHPVRRGQITVPALGMSPQVVDDRGASVIGQRGDLVCTEAFPTMPLTFWGEGGHERYLATYFADRREIWTHGDIAEMTVTGGAFVHGRSDTTLKPGGVRIGTAEVYAICETCPEIDDMLMFGADADGDEIVVLAIRPAADGVDWPTFATALRRRIRNEVSPRHVPARIHIVRDIPYTINGKRVEGAARTAINGGTVVNLSSLANPESIEEYRGLDASEAF